MIIDISPLIHPAMPVWPGDAPVTFTRTASIGSDSPVNVSQIGMSVHTGAHVDAPFHFDADGQGIDEVALSIFVGACRVIDLAGARGVIAPEQIVARLADCPPRVLLRTRARTTPDTWDADFCAVAPATVDLLASAGVKLIGLDTPSLDPADSEHLEAHLAVCRHRMLILEWLVLDEVAEGDYELIALPLKLAGLDGSPVRAILRTVD